MSNNSMQYIQTSIHYWISSNSRLGNCNFSIHHLMKIVFQRLFNEFIYTSCWINGKIDESP